MRFYRLLLNLGPCNDAQVVRRGLQKRMSIIDSVLEKIYDAINRLALISWQIPSDDGLWGQKSLKIRI